MFDSVLPSGGMLISFALPRPISSGKMVSWNYITYSVLPSVPHWWITARGSLTTRGQGHSLTSLVYSENFCLLKLLLLTSKCFLLLFCLPFTPPLFLLEHEHVWLITLCSALLQRVHTSTCLGWRGMEYSAIFFNTDMFYLLVSQQVVFLASVARLRISHGQLCLLIDRHPELPRVSFQQFIKSIADSTTFNLLKLKMFIYLTQNSSRWSYFMN